MCKIAEVTARRARCLAYLQHCSRPYGSPELGEVQAERKKAALKAYNAACADLEKVRREGAK